jgi:hypothetical protein
LSRSKKEKSRDTVSPSYQRQSADASARHLIIIRHCSFTIRSHYLLLPSSFPPLFIVLVVCRRRRLRCRLHLPLPPPFKIVSPTRKTHATPAATPGSSFPPPNFERSYSFDCCHYYIPRTYRTCTLNK